jgi:cytidine deaminase
MATRFVRLANTMMSKRKAHYCGSGFTSLTNSNHMCAILKDGAPISYGTNVYNIDDISTEHAEAQALRKLYERVGKTLNAKKMSIDILVVRTNGGNSKPCIRCMATMKHYSQFFSIRYVYYTYPGEPNGIRTVKFSHLAAEEPHVCAFDRNLKKMPRKNIDERHSNGRHDTRKNSNGRHYTKKNSSYTSSDSDSD